MAVICSTIEGKMRALFMAMVRLVPVATSRWICVVASAYRLLPEAPPTESSASTSGTPAANMVDMVRVQRATVDFSTSVPNTGSLSSTRSMTRCTLRLRFQACIKKYKPPPSAPNTIHQ